MTRYVDDIDIEAFTKKTIQNMLSELDPYTVFLENEERDDLEMLTQGKYGGIGIQIGRREEILTVIAPMDDTPAYRAGIISGDKIIKIDETFTKDISLDEASNMIRGAAGTAVTLLIERFGAEEPLEFNLVREDITVNDVTYYGMLDENTGYIRLARFSKNSVTEMRQVLQDLNGAGAIILDLRDNPGGLLQSAVGVLDLFIEKGEVLVTTKGKHKEARQILKSMHNPIVAENVKVAVLINGGSASASEIVAGTIQDLDRGVVLGTRSFGKGLVQTVYNYDRNRSLKITTAKYYIPSGRLIQKPDYNNSEVIAWTAKEDSVFTTMGGRSVKGGGGIFPDIVVENEAPSTLVRECWRKGLFFTYAQANRDRFDSIDKIIIDDAILDDFEAFLCEHNLDLPISGETELDNAREKLTAIDSTDTDLAGAFSTIETFIRAEESRLFLEEIDRIKPMLKSEFANLLAGSKGKVAVTIKTDPAVKKAQDVVRDNNEYNDVFVVK